MRDLDVLLHYLRAELATLDETDREAGSAFVERLEGQREAACRRLSEALGGDAYRLVLTRLRLPPRLADGNDVVPLGKIARKEFRRLARAVDRLGKQPEESELHRVRIALKRARYAAELEAPKGGAGKRFLADARVLQDLLGEYQDAVVAEQRLRAVTVDDARTGAAFVAGRIAERQLARRAHVRDQLPAAWKRLRKRAARLG